MPSGNILLVGDDKYFIDKEMLDNRNILEIRHVKNRHLTNIKPIRVSDKVKDLVYKLIDENINVFDFKGLKTEEKALLKLLAKQFNVSLDIIQGDEMDEDFRIMLGEIEAGNDSDLLKRKLKSYIYTFIAHGRLSRSAGMNLINQYGL